MKTAFSLKSAQALMLAGLTLALQLNALAAPEPFSAMPVFADSLADTGNLYRMTGGYPPSPPYAEGRFSNGPLWVEYLSESLGMTYQPDRNYAVGGATTGTANVNDTPTLKLPGLVNEIDSYLAGGCVGEPERALFIVGAGANDFFAGLTSGRSPAGIIAAGVENTIEGVLRLRASGARYIMVMNVPDLGITPYGRASANPAVLTALCAAYNDVLASALNALDSAGVPTMRLDAFAVLQQMFNDPAAFGFKNVTTPLLYAPAGSVASEFLFWDPVHPTTGAHRVLAAEAMEQILKKVSPRQGQAAPEALGNALHGLIRADLQHQ